ncbi:odorant receptor 131-2-like [Lepisosteus oculatus]|uniref:odorant receptor 131-2-like n=1 Tax=Lepisosteus oculatus TaxID=7918 RepID=UPI00371F4A40
MEIVSRTSRFVITAMCLEPYVAICLPLRHADISILRRTLAGILFIWALSSLYAIIDLFIFTASAPPSYYEEKTFCRYEILLLTEWHTYMRAILSNLEFVVIGIILLKTVIVQVLVGIFLCVNCFMLFTFFKKAVFWATTRYILFAHTLLNDSVLLLLTDLVALQIYLNILVPVEFCILLCMIMEVLSRTTRFVISAMCLERYVAICLPLRHADISTLRRTLAGILFIWALSSLYAIIDLFIFTATAPPSYFAQKTFCSYEILLLTEWHKYMRIIRAHLEFAIIGIILVFCYIKITIAARAASGDNKKSSSKAQKTLLLHTMQLLLCLIEMLCPFVEIVVLEFDFQIFVTVRYFNFIAFTLASRCLSPLVYGLRDAEFFNALKYYACFRLKKTVSPHFVYT